MSFLVARCQQCGAALEAQPDNLLTVCQYCGALYPAKDLGEIPVHIVPSVGEAVVRRCVKNRMATDPDMRGTPIKVVAATGVYVPLYVSRVSVKGHWRGYRMVKRNKRTVKVWKDGKLEESGDVPVLARQHAHAFGLSALGQVIFDADPIPMDEMQWEDASLPVLSVERRPDQATAVLKDDAVDHLGERVKAAHKLKALTTFEAPVQVEDWCLLLFPLWEVTYRHEGGHFKVAVAGAGPTVLAAMEPVFFGQRVWRLVLGIAAIAGAGSLALLAGFVLPSLDDDSLGGLAVLGAGILGCATVAWSTAKKLVLSVNVERIGEGA